MNLDKILTEARNPATMHIDSLSALEFAALVNAEDAKVIAAVAAVGPAVAATIEIVAERLADGGRLVYLGAGTSGRLGVLDASECPPTFNSPPGLVVGVIAGGPKALTTAVEGAEDHPEFAVEDLKALDFNAKDVLVGIATSGRTPYVIGGLKYAREIGAKAIGLACSAESELVPVSDFVIEALVGPEVLTGSTRLKAGTATKLILNMITTGAMVRLGKTYGNLMVDLRATNKKLIARTNRIVRLLTGLKKEEAEELLSNCGGELKTALVSNLANVPVDEAREKLNAAGGRVRRAVEGDKQPTMIVDLVLGVDGGGTKTNCLLAMRDGTVVAEGKGGPSNLQSVGLGAAMASIEEAVTDAFAKLGQPRAKVRAACLGLAGAGRAEDQQLVRTWAERYGLAEKVEVCGDVEILLACGTMPDRIAVICGTGSAVFGQRADGARFRVGGWGPILGDGGSGYHLALTLLRDMLERHDAGAPPSACHLALQEEMGIAGAAEAISAIHRHGWDRRKLAGLAPIILGFAGTDPDVMAMVESCAAVLAEQVGSIRKRMELGREFQLLLSGGLVEKSELYRGTLLDQLAESNCLGTQTLLIPNAQKGAVKRGCGMLESTAS